MKNFFYKLSAKFARFMQGRNGSDRLSRDMLWIYLAVILLGTILGNALNSQTLYYIFYVISLAIVIFDFYRIFSKKLDARRKENARWLAFIASVKKKFRLLADRFKFRKTHIFRRCPKCKAVLRLKKVKGKHTVCCPHCAQKFSVRVI
ncbi:MAG: DUF2207 domain-containing protein [Clostridiales bacterium]|nr:DUF2207 domain-containing protein [Clostridiales bacterium]